MWKGWRSVVVGVSCVMGGVEVCGWGEVEVGGGSMSALL